MAPTWQKAMFSLSSMAYPATRINHSYPDRAPKGTCGHPDLRLQSVPELSVSV